LVSGEIRTAAAEYTSEWQPGNILPNGTADARRPAHGVLNINATDLLGEGGENPNYDLWINEAYLLGALIKRNQLGQPILSPTWKYIPEMYGDQMLWMVYNDLDSLRYREFSTLPTGLECQTLLWAYDKSSEFGDMIFESFLIVNKGQETMTEAYFGLWGDLDIGDYHDDLAFSDSILALGGVWNDAADDDFGDKPPASGLVLLQGPVVPSIGDTAKTLTGILENHANLPLISIVAFDNCHLAPWHFPHDARTAYNSLKGLEMEIGSPHKDHVGHPTKFWYLSDPESATGHVDGRPCEKRLLLGSGPFTLPPWQDLNNDHLAQPGEPGVQEIVAAFLVAQGTSAANSATKLKRIAGFAHQSYRSGFTDFPTSVESPSRAPLPENFTLKQNYPNPFNPSTKIEYEISQPGRVTRDFQHARAKDKNTGLAISNGGSLFSNVECPIRGWNTGFNRRIFDTAFNG